MKRRSFLHSSSIAGAGLCLSPALITGIQKDMLNVGIIGLDTSHAVAFTKIINNGDTGCRLTHAYPHGSKDIESSVSRIPGYTREMEEMGITITSSIEELLAEVDVVLLETNDGRRHLEQATQVIKANKPLFIDKPMAASLKDVVKIFDLAKAHQVPLFSSSSLRFSPSMQAIKDGSIGKVLGASTFSPAKLEPTHPDLFWYGIHGVESLFTLMGTGCQSVRRTATKDTDVVVGEWADGRIGTFRGLRTGKTSYGGTAFGTEGIAEAGIYEGYEHLVKEIIHFFKTEVAPIPPRETLEIFAFMTAADRSKAQNGETVRIAEVLDEAK